MKNVILTIAICFAMVGSLFAQKHDSVSSHIDLMAAFSYNASPDEINSFSGLTNAGGFFGAVSYAQTVSQTSLLVTGYMKINTAANEDALQPLYDKAGWEVNDFTSDVYFSTGLLMGMKIGVQQRGDYSIPDFYFNVQAGFCSVRIPEHQYEFFVPDDLEGMVTYKKNQSATMGIGSALNLAFEADLLESQGAFYNLKLGMLMENARALSEFQSAGADPDNMYGFETIKWSSVSAYLGVSVKFGL